ncbi:MAG: sigma-70 family RNA polymerase sigma factor [Gammaproteobacteria bacterium]|nr:sigma-70 family RNA polymerase sigma factor [Gammaproteobacteria bacterium]
MNQNGVNTSAEASVLDQITIDKVLNGDLKAFEILVLKYQQKIALAIYSYIKDADEVQDVVQEIFVKAYRYLPEFRGDSSFYSWLYRIAINTAKNVIKARSVRPPRQDIDVHESYFPSDISEQVESHETPDKTMQNQQLLNITQQVVDSLPAELNQVLVYREIDGLDYKEIAKKTSVPVGTVRSRLFRAREMVSKEVRSLIGD